MLKTIKLLLIICIISSATIQAEAISSYTKDVELEESSIKFSSEKLEENQSTKIFATIKNNSNEDLKGIVRFFIDSTQLEEDQNFSMIANENDTVFVSYTPSIVDKKLKIVIIPNQLNEDDPLNNFYTQDLNINEGLSLNTKPLEYSKNNENELNKLPQIRLESYKKIVRKDSLYKINASPSLDSDGQITDVTWETDGVSKRGYLFEHVFTKQGIYTIKLTIKDNTNGEINKLIQVYVIDFQFYFSVIGIVSGFLFLNYLIFILAFRGSHKLSLKEKIQRLQNTMRNTHLDDK